MSRESFRITEARDWQIPDHHIDDLIALEKVADEHDGGCGCPGWGVFSNGADDYHVERCDECARFADDLAATAHAVALLVAKGGS